MKIDDQNIVLIVADTLSAFHLPFNGYDRDTAPFLTELAENNFSTKFGYANAPWTVPSHASLFSGELPFDHGTTSKNMFFDSKSFVEDLSESGYRTIGISNNNLISKELGFDRGFDYFISGKENIYFEGNNLSGFSEFLQGEGEDRTILGKFMRLITSSIVNKDLRSIYYGFKYYVSKFRRGGPELNFYPDSGANSSNKLVREELSDQEGDFFLFVNYMEPHGSFLPPVEYAAQWLDDPEKALLDEVDTGHRELLMSNGNSDEIKEKRRALYDAEIRYLDDKIKELYNFVERESSGETVYVIVGDHGEMLGESGIWGHRGAIWEKLIRVPIIIAGSDVEHQVIDLNVSLRELYDFMRGEKSLDELGAEELFAEYYGSKGFMVEFNDRDWDTLSEWEKNFFENESKCIVSNKKGYIENSNIEDRGFVATEDEYCEENKRDKVGHLKEELNEMFSTDILGLDI